MGMGMEEMMYRMARTDRTKYLGTETKVVTLLTDDASTILFRSPVQYPCQYEDGHQHGYLGE
jgi:hypothetical protein